VSICTINLTKNHAKSVIEKLQSKKELPFQDVLSSEAIQKYLPNTPRRDRIFSPETTLFSFLSQVISSDQSCQAAVVQVIAQLADESKEVSANTAAYCKARARLPEDMLSGLAREAAEQQEKCVPPEWLWRGRHVKLIDGTCISMPDTPENQAVYPQPDTQKKGLASPLLGLLQ